MPTVASSSFTDGADLEASAGGDSPSQPIATLLVVDDEAAVRRVLDIRESADRLFRSAVLSGELPNTHLPALLRSIASCVENSQESASNAAHTLSFESALATSALSLLAGQEWRKVRICRNCNWLFVDRSRNASRLWCDMSVCGNRQKAKRHYERRKAAAGDIVHG